MEHPKKKNFEDDLPDLPDLDVVNYYIQKEKKEFEDSLKKSNHRQVIILGRQLMAEIIMLYTGLRVEEVSNLDYKDIDLDRMILIVRNGKGNKDRIVDISEKLGQVLKWYVQQIYPLVLKEKNINLRYSLPLSLSERQERISKKTIQGRL
ncbi:MAG: tyrosine-type recombinase/integrase [Desulfitobacteriaceae bacterium]|nr:tyrosine-type recombinase/integrase [Desulfitobacteriaceae bacterium]